MKLDRLVMARVPPVWLLVAGLLVGGCTRSSDIIAQLPPNSPFSQTGTILQLFDTTDRSQYRYLYAVYCNGTVDRLDLVQREKVGSFHLSERSGEPPAVPALPLPGFRPDTCMTRPVVTNDKRDQADGVVRIIASAQLNRDSDDGLARFSLLTFKLPDWTLQQSRELGRFDPAPRLVRTTDGYLVMQPFARHPDGSFTHALGSSPKDEMAAQVQDYSGADDLDWLSAIEWSAGNVLLSYALPNNSGTGFALARQGGRRVVRIAEKPKGEISPARRLAPGGEFVLFAMNRAGLLGEGIHKVEPSGELRLYDTEGHLVKTVTDPAIAGDTLALVGTTDLDDLLMHNGNDWFPIALTPNGLAVFTDRRGNYHFVDMDRQFGVEPVVTPETDDWDGALPGIVYASE